uniref:alpha-galactosidase n=1 Tax=uncultured Altererythrobacter sp. TaxID=500840 RepID=UPI00262E3AB2|nr:alpha-galactosidase [uncultured Altererythrobacter sp.]
MTVDSGTDFIVLRASGTMIAVDARTGERPRILYAGPDLPDATPEELEALAKRQHAPGGPQLPIDPSWLNCIGTGHQSPPGLLAHSAGKHWALDPRVIHVKLDEALNHCVITTRDEASGLVAHHQIIQVGDPACFVFATVLSNKGEKPFSLEWLSAVCLPLDPRLIRVTSFTGKWASEFQTEQHDLVRGSFVRENRAGRTGHDSYPGFYLGTSTTSETHGLACAVHLAASGNHRIRIDRLGDDNHSLQAGDLLLPGEIELQPGQQHICAPIFAAWSDSGYGDVTRKLHSFVRDDLVKGQKWRPVHFNTWEAVYFDHSQDKLSALAEQAAEVGAERFVLDDGWFGARRNDRGGLGDWFVSKDVYPDGLKPLADHVRSLGMEFGLWFEPEMVNPDSDLYRAHPDWVLQVEGVEPIASRHQLPLDLTRPEVSDYLFDRITTLVRELDIAYIKWDMNRDIQHPGDAEGRPVMHAQTVAVSTLINRIRGECPKLAIESCSSGGARADYNMVERTGRIWTSDNNDARARHSIMRGAAHFLPLSVLGNHVGPKKCHITGRRFDMHFRAGTAVFGHMGMELDLARESDEDREVLKRAIALHKQHRDLIHEGNYHRLETDDHMAGILVVSADRHKAIAQLAVLDQHPAPHPPRLNFARLDPKKRYRVAVLWPEFLAQSVGSFAGSALMGYGLQLPQTHPDTCMIYHLEAET